MNNLDSFLIKNNISKNNFDAIIYKTLLLSIFVKIYNFLELGQNKFLLKKKLRDSPTKNSEHIVIENLIKSVTNISLSQNEENYLTTLIYAYLRKDSVRKKIDNNLKKELLIKQNYHCRLCNKKISIYRSHLDHIIPFKYVGDELNDNYQVLCSECNLSKSANVFYTINSLINKNSNIAKKLN